MSLPAIDQYSASEASVPRSRLRQIDVEPLKEAAALLREGYLSLLADASAGRRHPATKAIGRRLGLCAAASGTSVVRPGDDGVRPFASAIRDFSCSGDIAAVMAAAGPIVSVVPVALTGSEVLAELQGGFDGRRQRLSDPPLPPPSISVDAAELQVDVALSVGGEDQLAAAFLADGAPSVASSVSGDGGEDSGGEGDEAVGPEEALSVGSGDGADEAVAAVVDTPATAEASVASPKKAKRNWFGRRKK